VNEFGVFVSICSKRINTIDDALWQKVLLQPAIDKVNEYRDRRLVQNCLSR